MEEAKDLIRGRLRQVKTFLAQETRPKLSESDTKAIFLDPIISALGWEGIGVVTREYYVRNSQEFIDYVMTGSAGLLLAIEAKPLQTDLTDKHAAQLVQYCAVEGIEWAALTNGRELQFFNTFLKPDLAAKRILRLDLLAFNSDSDAEFDALFSQVWQLSRESMTTPSGVRTWLKQRRLDAALRAILLDSNSSTVRQLRRTLNDAEINATSQDVVQWFRSHLGAHVTPLPPSPFKATEKRPLPQPEIGGRKAGASPLFQALTQAIETQMPGVVWRPTNSYVAAEFDGHTFLAVQVRQHHLVLGLTLPTTTTSPRISENRGEFNWARMTKILVVQSESAIDNELMVLLEAARVHSLSETRKKAHHGVALRDLIAKGYLQPDIELVPIGQGGSVAARARLNASGHIEWNGGSFRSPSDKAFASLLGRQSLNGWSHWHIERSDGMRSLATIRERMQQEDTSEASTGAREA